MKSFVFVCYEWMFPFYVSPAVYPQNREVWPQICLEYKSTLSGTNFWSASYLEIYFTKAVLSHCCKVVAVKNLWVCWISIILFNALKGLEVVHFVGSYCCSEPITNTIIRSPLWSVWVWKNTKSIVLPCFNPRRQQGRTFSTSAPRFFSNQMFCVFGWFSLATMSMYGLLFSK